MNSFLIFLISAVVAAVSSEKPPPCDSDIYCHGPLLHTVQMAKLYKDSKTFVDMKLIAPPNETIHKFNLFMDLHNNQPSKADIKSFVETNFEPHNQEFSKWVPDDWVENPKFLDQIKDPSLKKWGSNLNAIWKDLGRQIKDDVRDRAELYSLIWVRNPFIVPGGRFREFYYWDSYWIIQGLLLSQMKDTVKGMLENFVYIVDQYGHVPNGGRIYYLERSQPPFLIPMVKLYIDATNDVAFIRKHINTLEKEFNYWMKNHVRTFEFNGSNYSLAVYGDNSKGPRPESYHEDIESGKVFNTDEEKEEFYSELKAAAESGWDFSSRWFLSTNKSIPLNLSHTKTRSIVPVDLNSFIYWNAVILKEFSEVLGNKNKAVFYGEVAEKWMDAVTEVLWDPTHGAWFDFDLINSVRKYDFHAANIAPLFTDCYPEAIKSDMVVRVLKYIRDNGLTNFNGGIPTTLEHTGEQWDYPNAWPPLQHMIIVGLNNTGDIDAKKLAYDLAEKWIKSNYVSYNLTEAMFEKYDAVTVGGQGGGGEYDVQLGFGWANGVVMYLLNEYGQHITLYDELPLNDGISFEHMDELYEDQLYPTSSPSTFAQATTAIVCLVISLLIGYIGFSICKRTSSGCQSSRQKLLRPSKKEYTELMNMEQDSRILT